MNRRFAADRPNELWVSDFTYVATWSGFVYVAFIIDVHSRFVVGRRVSSSMTTHLVIDALEMAVFNRRTRLIGDVIAHSDAGSQDVSVAYTERLAEIVTRPSIGTVGDSSDNALAESMKRALHNRTRPTSRSLAKRGARRDRDPCLHRMVQPPTSSRRTRPRSARRARSRRLRLPPSDHARSNTNPELTQFTGRFRHHRLGTHR